MWYFMPLTNHGMMTSSLHVCILLHEVLQKATVKPRFKNTWTVIGAIDHAAILMFPLEVYAWSLYSIHCILGAPLGTQEYYSKLPRTPSWLLLLYSGSWGASTAISSKSLCPQTLTKHHITCPTNKNRLAHIKKTFSKETTSKGKTCRAMQSNTLITRKVSLRGRSPSEETAATPLGWYFWFRLFHDGSRCPYAQYHLLQDHLRPFHPNISFTDTPRHLGLYQGFSIHSRQVHHDPSLPHQPLVVVPRHTWFFRVTKALCPPGFVLDLSDEHVAGIFSLSMQRQK